MITTIVVTDIQLLPPKSNSAIYDTEKKVIGDLWSEVRRHSENKWKHCTGQSAPWHW